MDERTFFVSYTGADENWATWVAECIESVSGWRATIQAWDFTASKNFGLEMHKAAEADHTVSIFTSAYFGSQYATAEWSAAWVKDPVGRDARVIPIVVEDCWPPGLMRPLIYIALTGITDEAAARAKLISEIEAAITGTRRRVSSGFPGAADAGSGPGRPAGSRTPIYGMGQPTQLFVGRRLELDRFKEMLAKNDISLNASIEGLGGIGKTELAKRLCLELAEGGHFGGGIYWLDAEYPDLTPEWVRIGLGLGLSSDASEVVACMMAKIAQAQDCALIVLDNVRSWAGDSQPKPLPSTNYRLLLTTRTRHLGGGRFEHSELGVLRPEDARALLTGIAGNEILESEGVDALLEHLDGHALGVEMAAAYLRKSAGAESPASYLEKLKAWETPGASGSDQTVYGQTVDGVLGTPHETREAQDPTTAPGEGFFEQGSAAVALHAEVFDVFLSYSHQDSKAVEKLCERLTDKAGLRVWLDKWVLVPGTYWQQGMAKGLGEARSCAVCLGEQTPRGWFREEIQRALNRQVRDPSFRVIPVILPGGNPAVVDEFLELRTWVRFRTGFDDPRAFHVLVSGIKGVPPGRGSGFPSNDPATSGQVTNVRKTLVVIRSLRNEYLIDERIAIEYQRRLLDRLVDQGGTGSG